MHWNKKVGKWQAKIHIDGKQHHLGLFQNYSDAVKSRKDAEKEFGVEKIPDMNDLEDERFGNFIVIGDTGKRASDGSKLLLCRHDDGSLHEIPKNNLRRGLSKGVGRGKRPGKSRERNISLGHNGTYQVHKHLNGKFKRFGTYPTLEEAIQRRDEVLKMIENGEL